MVLLHQPLRHSSELVKLVKPSQNNVTVDQNLRDAQLDHQDHQESQEPMESQETMEMMENQELQE